MKHKVFRAFYWTVPLFAAATIGGIKATAHTFIVLVAIDAVLTSVTQIVRARDSNERRFLVRFLASSYLTLVNPLALFQSILLGFGQLRWLGSRKSDGIETRQEYSLPVEGRWTIFVGGVTPDTSHSWAFPSQRYAYDLVKQPDTESLHVSGQFPSFDSPVVAPAEGTVTHVRDDIPDSRHMGTGWLDIWTRDIRGNFLVIKHASDEFSVLAHLRQGSAVVRAGELVQRGQLLAKCGNSGRSTEPHVHMQVQSSVSFYFSMGRKIRWSSAVHIQREASSNASPPLFRGDVVWNGTCDRK